MAFKIKLLLVHFWSVQGDVFFNAYLSAGKSTNHADLSRRSGSVVKKRKKKSQIIREEARGRRSKLSGEKLLEYLFFSNQKMFSEECIFNKLC